MADEQTQQTPGPQGDIPPKTTGAGPPKATVEPTPAMKTAGGASPGTPQAGTPQKGVEEKANLRIKSHFVSRFKQDEVVPKHAFLAGEPQRLVGLGAVEWTDDEATVKSEDAMPPLHAATPAQAPPDVSHYDALRQELDNHKAAMAHAQAERDKAQRERDDARNELKAAQQERDQLVSQKAADDAGGKKTARK